MARVGATVLIFDSGAGGLTVSAALRAVMPDAGQVYLADRAGFPYGALRDEILVARVRQVLQQAVARVRPDGLIIACNTASTLVLEDLRARFDFPVIGTVPAIKPAAARTRSGIVGLLATPATAARDYTRRLIDEFARDVDFTVHAAHGLAALGEQKASGVPVSVESVRRCIAPVFVTGQSGRTDVVVLGCTHYPLLRDEIMQAAPWPVFLVDPADAIARRARGVVVARARRRGAVKPGTALLNAVCEPGSGLAETLGSHGFGRIEIIDPPDGRL